MLTHVTTASLIKKHANNKIKKHDEQIIYYV